MEIALEIIFIALLFLGILLTALPAVPGMLYMFLLVLVYGIINSFETLEPWHFAIFGGLVILAGISDYASGLIGAKVGGANKKSIILGFIGLIIGLIAFPPLGLFIGLFLGVFLAELIQFKDHKKAIKTASFSFLGTISGMITNVVLAIIFFITFLVIIF